MHDQRQPSTKLVSTVIALSTVAAGALFTSVAVAQEERTTSRYDIEEIVVSARKREEGLQDAPLAITAISGEELENRGALDVIDFSDAAPNVSFKSNGVTSGFAAAPRTSIRGVGQTDFVINTDPAVGIYTDGVYLGRSIGAFLTWSTLNASRPCAARKGHCLDATALVARSISSPRNRKSVVTPPPVTSPHLPVKQVITCFAAA